MHECAGSESGKTMITWSTGDGSHGVIHVLMKSLQMRYPIDSGEAIEQLEALRAKGGEFLLTRSELFSWLEDHRGLKGHLDRHYCVVHDDETCLIYDLREMPSEDRSGDGSKLKGWSQIRRLK
jgi:hypothetical protein